MGNKEVLTEETIDLFFVFRDYHMINLHFVKLPLSKSVLICLISELAPLSVDEF